MHDAFPKHGDNRLTDEERKALAALRKYFVFGSDGNYRAMMKAAKDYIRAEHAANPILGEDQRGRA